MQNKYKYNFPRTAMIAMIFVFSAISCKKYLEQKPNTSLVSPASLSDLQAVLDDDATMNDARTPSYGEASSDEYFLTTTVFNKIAGRSDGGLEKYTWQYYPITGGGNDWSACYLPIYNANLVLDQLKNISIDPANMDSWDNVKGSALFYRSYYFLQLLWNYARAYDSNTAINDRGIVLRLTSDFNVPSLRSDNSDSYKQVITDTKAAIALLPDYALQPTRPSKGAAYGLIARSYLSMRDYKNALLYADSALQLHHQLMDFNGDEDIVGSLSAKGVFKKLNKEIIFYTEMNRYISITNTISYGRIDSTLYSSYNAADLRKKAYFYVNSDGYASYKGSYANIYSSCFSGIATDEMYLIRAECFIREDMVQKGLNDLDTLLSKRWTRGTFTPYQEMTQKEALGTVLKEREKELLMRALRWMDIKRLNKEGGSITLKRIENGQTYTLLPNAPFYALPIPEDIIQMTGIAQNK